LENIFSMSGLPKNIVISGCTRGIGYAIAELFASGGFNVAGCARSEKDLLHMQTDFEKRFPTCNFLFACCDMSKAEEVKTFAASMIKAWGKVDLLVNNAGVFLPGSIYTEEEGVLETLLAANLHSAYHLTRSVLPVMIKAQAGSIFNICSVASLKAYENGGSYCISKFALLGFSKQLREEMKPHGIKVTAIMPGATYTQSWANAGIPQSRFMPASDIAKSIWDIYHLSSTTDVEEVILRPQFGDI
jgi:short-subunit dehydrogenase